MSTSVNAQMAASNPYMIVGYGGTRGRRIQKRQGGAVPPALTKESIRSRLIQVENQIQAQGFAELMINTRADRNAHVESLLAENKLEQASAYIDRLAMILPQMAGKRIYRRKQTRKNKKHGKKV